ncbi:Crp/Fnr family transcriptional regulator [Cryobacterium arcticum]|uniref:Cyclic nucleotide-binding domain-containing protein n=1 Tax=Cryobacterium arcticum TaxID=670052 RepID=A0A1B1BKA9_9MICO|nr:Crp/Fnr family transcriptional regulator [Cryobacterium arcticum]ANP73119.1 hypothetical protein PA27867_2167 [Cryobacterium arcticum]
MSEQGLSPSALPLRAVPLRSTCGRPHRCPPAMQRRILEQIVLFQGLSGDELASIGTRITSLAWSAGEALFSAGEPGEHVYFLAAGQAKAFRTTATGQRTSLDFFGPGDVLGGLTWAGGSGYTETALALVTTCALQIDAGAFREVMLAYPSVALEADGAGTHRGSGVGCGDCGSRGVEAQSGRHPAPWMGQQPRSRTDCTVVFRVAPADPAPEREDVPEEFAERGVLAWADTFASV